MTSNEAATARVIECASPDILKGDDGFYIWWPTENQGAHEAWSLRVIADELDRKNAPWLSHLKTEGFA